MFLLNSKQPEFTPDLRLLKLALCCNNILYSVEYIQNASILAFFAINLQQPRQLRLKFFCKKKSQNCVNN